MRRAFPWAWIPCGAAAATACAALAATAMGRDVPWWVLGAAAGALAIAVAAGVFWLGAGLFARPILGAAAARSDGRVALTFDDGPDPRHTRAILDALDARGHRATFFVIGARAERELELLRELVRRGHALGNHSYEHRRTTPLLSARRLLADFTRAGELLARAGGATRWFRPPIGILSPPVARAAARAGLVVVGWTRSARDGVASTTVERAVARLLRAARPGAILVLHDAAERGDRRPIAPDALGPLLDGLEARGLKSVTLDELLGAPAMV